MITVHHLETSRSQRVLWLLEELGIDYKIKRYQRDPETKLAPAALKKIHPLGSRPSLPMAMRPLPNRAPFWSIWRSATMTAPKVT